MIKTLTLITIFAPLLGSLTAGLGAKKIGKEGAHIVTIVAMLFSFISSAVLCKLVIVDGQSFYGSVYTWVQSGQFTFDIGLMVDPLTVVMMTVVTFVSLLVHVYSMGYMRDDDGYQRFFCYVSLFTFMMLMLVTANNFLQLFFGWEGVGLVSYLLIGFWFKKDSAADGSLKAFLVNRVGDFGFILGLAAILDFAGTLDYKGVFSKIDTLTHQKITLFMGHHWSLDTVICLLLFIGAMGKSAQVPLHVWLPESMEGPTPISALIHAATMVTAGVFLVARMSPLFQNSPVALSVVLIIGSTGALFLGLLAFVENDIKRVVAYSTMSQLGYMMAANGAGAYQAGIFHLVTHASFKALLFLSAGSVIVAMHHVQDMRKMGGLARYLPVTYVCFLIGACALSAIPPFSGFFSKEAIIEVVHHSTMSGSGYAYACLLLGAFVTAYYIFRAFFMTFHGNEKMSADIKSHLREHRSMLFAMIMLAVPSVIVGGMLIGDFLFPSSHFWGQSFGLTLPNAELATIAKNYHGAWSAVVHAFNTLPFWFSVAGIVCAASNTLWAPSVPVWFEERFSLIRRVLIGQYGFDTIYDRVFVRGTKRLSHFLFHTTDLKLIDKGMVDGSGLMINRLSSWARQLQSGYLNRYVSVMVIGLIVFLLWMIF